MKYITLLFASIFYLTAARSQVIVTVAGTGVGGYSGDGGPATNATMEQPRAIAFDKDGNFYFTDDAIPRVRRVSPDGTITTVAGNGTSGYGGDGSPATLAQIRGGGGIAIDKWNNIYYADGSNYRIRKITTDGIIHTIAGTGIAGYNGDGIPATDAQLNIPEDITVDDTGNVYICDKVNYRIRRISVAGIISTIAGTGIAGFTPDGARADTSAIDENYCIVVDSAGNILFKDKNRIRKISVSTGLLSTLAGNGIYGYSGDGGPATAAGIATAKFAMDSLGNLYLGEEWSNRIRKVSTEGGITTIAGTGGSGLENNGANVLLARLYSPSGVAFSPSGELHYAEKGNGKIRKITHNWTGVFNTELANDDLQLYPNPAQENVMLVVKGAFDKAQAALIDAKGAVVSEQNVPTNTPAKLELAHCPPGIYTVRVITTGKTITKELLIK